VYTTPRGVHRRVPTVRTSKKTPSGVFFDVLNLFSVFNCFFCFFAAAFFFFAAAANGFAAFVFVSEAFVFTFVAAAVTFKGYLEVLLENSIYNNNECSDAYERADSDKNALEEGAVILLHGQIPFVMGFVLRNTVIVYHISRKIQYLIHEFFIKKEEKST